METNFPNVMNSDTKTIKIYDGVTVLLDNNMSGN